ncbi:hypothetical protein F4859DRAFT_506072 [Xylaria cf. heliscus]|nr:hypothetical protein F4859DRAFT_506072 [Xylaria cf. heliscus]
MATTTTKPVPTLPPVAAVRNKRSVKKPPSNHPYSFIEGLKYYTGIERDLIWGPFYRRFRAVRKESANWAGFSLRALWAGIPAASQTRPLGIVRLFNSLVGADPPPTITPPPPRSKTTTSTPSSPKNFDDWQATTGFKEDWSPSQIDFAQWYGRLKHPADYDDQFYTTNYKALYNKMCDFAESWFGQGIYLEDWRDSEMDISAWEVPMTDQFVQYVRAVVHEDKGYINWKDIINDPKHRKWLCVSVLSQIMERRIFNQLLFGAPMDYQKELDRHDSHWLASEGFTRKEGRRQIARAALGEHLVPENFWDAVDDLAGHTVLIFQPLFMLMCMATRRAANIGGAAFWQEVHSIIALAGYFQVCTAISPSIFHILSATPGVRFQWEEEEHADQEIYEASKSFHKSHEDRWRVLAEYSSKSDNAAVTKLTEPDDVDSTLYMPFPTSETEYRVMDHQRRRGGKVMYAVFPKLTRYTAENVGNIILDVKPATSQDELLDSEGMRISLLSRCMVVYYQGLVHDKSDWADGVPLDEHLRQISMDRLNYSILPYWRRYWNANGSPRFWLHWPVWPDRYDKFWLGVIIYVFSTRILESYIGPFQYREDRRLYEAYLLRPLLWVAVDVFIYIIIRLCEVPLLDGRYIFLKTQVIYAILTVVIEFLLRNRSRNLIFFSFFAWPLFWLDHIFLHKFPEVIMSASLALRNEDIGSLAARAAGLFRAANGSAAGL